MGVLRQAEKPLYWDHHEAFRRLLIMGGASLVIGVFYGEQASSGLLVSWIGKWLPVIMWGSGLVVLAMCFLLHPKQYSIYPDSLAVEWWYLRRKVIPFDEITDLKIWSNLGKKQLTIISRGPDYDFGWNSISPRNVLAFAERLEEALNRRRFYAGRDPIVVVREDIKDKKKD